MILPSFFDKPAPVANLKVRATDVVQHVQRFGH